MAGKKEETLSRTRGGFFLLSLIKLFAKSLGAFINKNPLITRRAGWGVYKNIKATALLHRRWATFE